MIKGKFSGQSTLEYIAITTLVIVGIIGMGPYVIRSVNAYFESAQDQAQDSFREEMHQSPLVFIDRENELDMGPDCSCDFSDVFVCGDGDSCGEHIEMKELECTPNDCELEIAAKGGVVAECYERSPDEQGRQSFNSSSCYPGCHLSGDLNTCPIGFSNQSNEDIFGNCGYLCCQGPEAVVPPKCGTGSRSGYQLMVWYCGPNLKEQYFWEESDTCGYSCGVKDSRAQWCDPATYNVNVPPGDPIYHISGTDACEQEALDRGCAPSDWECKQDAWTCMAECNASQLLVASSDGLRCECEAPWEWDTHMNMCGCYQEEDGPTSWDRREAIYTSPVYPKQITFRVRVWTEDLNFCIKFFDDSGTMTYSIGGDANGNVYYNPSNIDYYCNAKSKDSSNDVDYAPSQGNFFYRSANQVFLKVREGGGGFFSPNLGYHVDCIDPSIPL